MVCSLRPHDSVLELPVGEIQVLLPVIGRYIVATAPHVVRNGIANRMFECRHGRIRYACHAIESIQGRYGLCREKLSLRIGKRIVNRAANVERPRSDEREQEMSIYRQVLNASKIVLVVRAEPVREG